MTTDEAIKLIEERYAQVINGYCATEEECRGVDQECDEIIALIHDLAFAAGGGR